MLLEKELVDFMNAQKPSESINEIINGLELLKKGLNDFKQELSESLPIFFMSGDKKSIERCLKYGEQVDNAILNLNSINLKNKVKSLSSENHIENHNAQSSYSNTSTTAENKIENKTEVLQKPIKLIVVKDKFCPYCKEKFLNTKTAYTIFKDKNKKQMDGIMITPTYRCEKCNKYFINQELLDIIDISKSNIEPVHITKKCIQCGETVYNNSSYCWEHYKYHNAESK